MAEPSSLRGYPAKVDWWMWPLLAFPVLSSAVGIVTAFAEGQHPSLWVSLSAAEAIPWMPSMGGYRDTAVVGQGSGQPAYFTTVRTLLDSRYSVTVPFVSTTTSTQPAGMSIPESTTVLVAPAARDEIVP